MDYTLEDLIDMEQFQSLQDRLNEIYSFPSAIIDNDGKVLTATAWQDICTKFHRQNKESEKECVKSDQYILAHLADANPAVSYQCPHGLIDNATPIVVDGKHLGNFFTGQFFLEKPDLAFFKNQAERYGFDEETYLAAVRSVPIWSKEQLNSYLFFIKGLIQVITSIALKNTGLGLSVVHGIVKAHEARIEVQSTLGEGSEFRIYFPATEESVLADTALSPDTAPVQGNGKHVLYVDDEKAIVSLMKRMLERRGYRVSGYTDPKEALAAARANPDQFDLVVTDYNMPGVSGLEVAKAMKEIRADLPVVLASGYITEDLRAEAPAAGVSELIYKPNTVDDLSEAVARYANTQRKDRGIS